MSTINFTQLKEEAANNEFPTLDAGNYEFTVIDSEFKTSAAGNPMIQLNLEEVESKIKVREFLTLTNKAAFKLFEFLENAGVEPPAGELDQDSDEFATFVDDLVGETVTAEVTIRDYVNKDGNKAKSNNIKTYVDKSKVGKGKRRSTRKL